MEVESVMDLYLSTEEDYSGQGGRVSMSTFDAGTVDDYLDFMRRRPRGHPLALDIPNRDHYRGKIYDKLQHPQLFLNTVSPSDTCIFRTFVSLSQSGRSRYCRTATNEYPPVPPRGGST